MAEPPALLQIVSQALDNAVTHADPERIPVAAATVGIASSSTSMTTGRLGVVVTALNGTARRPSRANKHLSLIKKVSVLKSLLVPLIVVSLTRCKHLAHGRTAEAPMKAVTLASARADSDVVEAARSHHAALAAALATGVETLVDAVSERDVDTFARARADLVEWLNVELVPHAVAEEEAIYSAAGNVDPLQALVRVMADEHDALLELVIALDNVDEMVRAAGVATAIRELFDVHRRKEDDELLPVLAADSTVSLGDLFDGLHHLLGSPGRLGLSDQRNRHDHDCACGAVDEGDPELDVREVPHAIRHATVFGALSAVSPGTGLVLVAPHDPVPLLAQAERLYPDMFTVNYLQRGPDAWRLHFARVA